METEKFILFFLLVCSVTIHEWAHAWTADKLGDPLPRKQGRVTLDPRSHVDLIGTILLPLIMLFANPGFGIIGWGKPVQVSLPNKEKKVRDDILITAAGPFSNLCIIILSSLVFGIVHRFNPLGESSLSLFIQIISLNSMLFVFNLVPIPPLDGSHFLKHLVGMKEATFFKFSKYGFFILIVLVNIPLFQIYLGNAINGVSTFCIGIFSLLQN